MIYEKIIFSVIYTLGITKSLVVLFLTVFLIWYIRFRNSRRRMYKLAEQLPALPMLPIIGHSHYLMCDTEDFLDRLYTFSDHATKNNGITSLWLGPIHYILLTNPEYIEIILNECLQKDYSYKFMKPWLGEGLLCGDVSIWKRHRKTLMPSFSQKILDSFMETFNDHAAKLVGKIEEKIGFGWFDACQLVAPCTLDTVCATAMGVEMNVQENLESPYFKASKSQMDIAFQRMFKIMLHPNIIYHLSKLGVTQRHNIQILKSFTQKIIDKRKREYRSAHNSGNLPSVEENTSDMELKNGFQRTTEKKALLDHMIELSESGGNWSDEEIRNEVDTVTVAGFDTSAQTISFVLMVLGSHLHVQDRVIEEQRQIFGDYDGPVTKEDLPKMQYLERVIKETLRMFPVAPIIVRKSEKEVKLGNYLIPKDTGCVISIMAVQRRKDIWGPDAADFNPDRFISDQSNRHPYAYIPFSAGPRNCIGKQYAMMQMKLMVSKILRSYSIKSETDIVQSMHLKIETILKPVAGFKIKIEKRL